MNQNSTEPELLKGLGVNWDGYIPAGGHQWQELFDAEILPDLNKMIDELIKERQAKCSEDIEYSLVNDSLKDAEAKIAEVQKILLGRVGKIASLSPVQNDWLEGAVVNITLIRERINTSKGCSRLMEDINNDIKFLTDFRDFILVDRVFDKLMFGLFGVEDKYRTKIGREGFRMVQIQLQRLETIMGMKGKLQDHFRSQFDDELNDLSKSYAEVSLMLRKMKKSNFAIVRNNNGIINNMVINMRREMGVKYTPKFVRQPEKEVA